MNPELTSRTAQLLRSSSEDIKNAKALVGIDAFVDEIIRVVDKRSSASEYTQLALISELGARIVSAAGQSTNIELVVERMKLGGNGPIMANAFATFGPDVTCVGPFGEGGIHPAFAELAGKANVISIGEPGHTDALEFEDGKLMLGKLQTLQNVTWERLLERFTIQEVESYFLDSDLLALVNWTMIPSMSQIWENALQLIDGRKARGRFFFDLADPEKHSDTAVADACHLLSQFQAVGPTILGLNEKEAIRVAKALGHTGTGHGHHHVSQTAAYISRVLPVETVVVHPRAYAVVASKGVSTALVEGPFTDNPLISTGAGDHFNAGFCLGKLLGFADDESATVAVGTSGYYVRNAASPTVTDLANFLENESKKATV